MKSILLIEATPEVSRPVGFILRRAGFVVSVVRKGEEALAVATTEAPDLILADLVLAGSVEDRAPGAALNLALRRAAGSTNLPVIALVPPGADLPVLRAPGVCADAQGLGLPAFASPEEEALAGAADEAVRIPVNPFELLAKVRFLLAEEGRRPPPRVNISRVAEVNAGVKVASGSLMNLSGSGALIETDGAEDIDGEVVLRFSLPDSTRVLEPLARVVRRMAPDGGRERIALEFKNLDGETRRALESFLFLRG